MFLIMRNFQKNFSLGIDYKNVSFKTTRIKSLLTELTTSQVPSDNSTPSAHHTGIVADYILVPLWFSLHSLYHCELTATFPLSILNESIFIKLSCSLIIRVTSSTDWLSILLFSNSRKSKLPLPFWFKNK